MKLYHWLLFFIVLGEQHILAQTAIDELSYEQLDSIIAQKVDVDGAYQAALPYIERALPISMSKGDSLYCNMLLYLGIVKEVSGAYTVADSLYRKAAVVAENAFGKFSPLFIEVQSNQAMLYRAIGAYDKAEEMYKSNLELCEQVYGKKHLHYGHVLSGLGVLYRHMGRFKEVEPLYRAHEQIVKDTLGTEHSEYLTVLNNLAVLYNLMGKNQESEILYQKNLALQKKLKLDYTSNYASCLNNLAHLYESQGRYEEAEPLIIKVLAILERAMGKQSSAYLKSQSILVSIYMNIEAYPKAIAILNELLENKAMFKQNQEYPRLLSLLGRCQIKTRAYQDAEKSLQEALTALNALNTPLNLLYAKLYNLLINLYRKTGALDKASAIGQENIAFIRKAIGEENVLMSKGLLALATIECQKKNYQQALELGYQSLEVNSFTKVALDKNWSIPFIQKIAVQQYQDLENAAKTMRILNVAAKGLALTTPDWLDRAYALDVATVNIVQRYKNEVLFDKDKLRILKSLKASVEDGLDIAVHSRRMDLLNHAFELMEQNKSILLAETLQSKEVQKVVGVPDSIINQEKVLQKKIVQLQKALQESNNSQELKQLQMAVATEQAQYASLKKMLEEQYPNYYKMVYADDVVKASAIQELLDDKTLFMEFFIGEQFTFVAILTADSVHLTRIAVSELNLMQQVEHMRKNLTIYTKDKQVQEVAKKSYEAAAYSLYQLLLQPILEQYSNKTNLKIVTDGSLGHIPFETLLFEEGKGRAYKDLPYLIRKYTISYDYSASVFHVNSLKKQKANGKILAMGASYDVLDTVALTQRSYSIQEVRGQLNPLEMVDAEVLKLKEDLKLSGKYKLGMDANEKAFKEEAADYSIIHLAMHGLLNVNESALSSLAFTENGDALEDNFLYAYEISNMDLNAELVVLSACETGYGKFAQGEGVMSLARNFMRAGVPSLVVSLWQVNDFTTARIMQLFYQNLLEGQSKSEALRAAKLTYLQHTNGIGAHPMLWSPFIQLGNDAPVDLNKQGNLWYWGLGVGVLLLLLIMLFKRRGAAV